MNNGIWHHHIENFDKVCPICLGKFKRGFYNPDVSGIDDICYVCAALIYDAFQKFVIERQNLRLEIPKDNG